MIRRAESRRIRGEARVLLEAGTFDGGMRPKVRSALDALDRGARSAVICGNGQGALERDYSVSGRRSEQNRSNRQLVGRSTC